MLLFDENLPRHLVRSLADLYPKSDHVLIAGLGEAADGIIWKHAADTARIIVSKDKDFFERARVAGPPPKVIWLRCGNCPTAHLEFLLRNEHAVITEFANDPARSVLVLGSLLRA